MTTAKQQKTTLRVRCHDGSYATRTTHHAYTHVLFGRAGHSWENGEVVRNKPATEYTHPLQWCKSEANAAKAMSTFRARGFIDFHVVPVEAQ